MIKPQILGALKLNPTNFKGKKMDIALMISKARQLPHSACSICLSWKVQLSGFPGQYIQMHHIHVCKDFFVVDWNGCKPYVRALKHRGWI